MRKYILHIDELGTKRWYLNGNLHREDGPAIVYADGSKCWCIDDNLHRLDGPAEEWISGTIGWFRNGKYLGDNAEGFWPLWDMLTDEQRNNLSLLMHLPGLKP